jgi:hypothetical protein
MFAITMLAMPLALQLTTRMVALARFTLGNVNIAATTALQVLVVIRVYYMYYAMPLIPLRVQFCERPVVQPPV